MPGNLISEFSPYFFFNREKKQDGSGIIELQVYTIARSASIWKTQDFSGGAVVRNSPASAGAMDSVFSPGRSHMPQGNWVCVP